MAKAKVLGMTFDFASLMNEAIRSLPERALTKRSHIWASEIGHSFVDRYLKMNGHIPTNPPNDRSRRKFISGHIFEWIIQLILTVCGILRQKQLRGEVQLPGCLMVSGKLDFIVGGEVIDWELARQELKTIQRLFALSLSEMPPIIEHSIERILFKMEQMFSRVPLKEVVLECKSVSGFVSDLIDKTGKPRQGHPLQTLHYLLANKLDEGMLLYVNKDSFLCHQFTIHPSKDLLKTYKDDVKQMTEYYNNSGKNYLKNMPPKESEILFYDEECRFAKNNFVEYSPYLTMLYGYKDFDEFNEKWKKPIASWNRTFKRCVTGANMTPLNKQVIAEASKVFPLWDKYVAKAKASGIFDKPEQEGEDE